MTEAAEVLGNVADVSRDEKTDDKESNIPNSVRFALGLHVGDSARVKANLEWLSRPKQEVGEDWDALFLCPGLWEALSTGVAIQTFTGDEAEMITIALCEELVTRAKQEK